MRARPLLLLICLTGAAAPIAAQHGAAGASAKRSTLLVTAARVVVDQAGYQGPCPAKLLLTATITAAAPLASPISYQWVRSDGTKGPKRSLRMAGTSGTVTDHWKLGVSGQMMRAWSELHILSPNRLVSNQATTSVLCR